MKFDRTTLLAVLLASLELTAQAFVPRGETFALRRRAGHVVAATENDQDAVTAMTQETLYPGGVASPADAGLETTSTEGAALSTVPIIDSLVQDAELTGSVGSSLLQNAPLLLAPVAALALGRQSLAKRQEQQQAVVQARKELVQRQNNLENTDTVVSASFVGASLASAVSLCVLLGAVELGESVSGGSGDTALVASAPAVVEVTESAEASVEASETAPPSSFVVLDLEQATAAVEEETDSVVASAVETRDGDDGTTTLAAVDEATEAPTVIAEENTDAVEANALLASADGPAPVDEAFVAPSVETLAAPVAETPAAPVVAESLPTSVKTVAPNRGFVAQPTEESSSQPSVYDSLLAKLEESAAPSVVKAASSLEEFGSTAASSEEVVVAAAEPEANTLLADSAATVVEQQQAESPSAQDTLLAEATPEVAPTEPASFMDTLLSKIETSLTEEADGAAPLAESTAEQVAVAAVPAAATVLDQASEFDTPPAAVTGLEGALAAVSPEPPSLASVQGAAVFASSSSAPLDGATAMPSTTTTEMDPQAAPQATADPSAVTMLDTVMAQIAQPASQDELQQPAAPSALFDQPAAAEVVAMAAPEATDSFGANADESADRSEAAAAAAELVAMAPGTTTDATAPISEPTMSMSTDATEEFFVAEPVEAITSSEQSLMAQVGERTEEVLAPTSNDFSG